MTKNHWIIIGITALLLVGVIALINRPNTLTENNNATTSPVGVLPEENIQNIPSQEIQVAYGEVRLALNQRAILPEGFIRIISVDEDSRCPQGVQCIQAGTVKTTMEYFLNGTTKRETLELNKSIIRGSEKITLTMVTPAPVEGTQINVNNYRFTLNVTKNSSGTSNPGNPVATGKCFVGGCSGQICSGEEGAISTCEFKEEYACYKTAKCERQSTGQCGWTQTSALNMCLAAAR